MPVGEPAVVEDLKQEVEDIVVCLLDFVEEDDGVGSPANRFGKKSALLVANVARRSADESCDRVPFHKLRHIHPNHRPLVVEQEFGERLCEFGLSDAGGAHKNERADRSVRVAETCSRPSDCVGNQRNRLVLPNDTLFQTLFHPNEFLGLALQHLRHWNPRPLRNHLCDVLLVDLFL